MAEAARSQLKHLNRFPPALVGARSRATARFLGETNACKQCPKMAVLSVQSQLVSARPSCRLPRQASVGRRVEV